MSVQIGVIAKDTQTQLFLKRFYHESSRLHTRAHVHTTATCVITADVKAGVIYIYL